MQKTATCLWCSKEFVQKYTSYVSKCCSPACGRAYAASLKAARFKDVMQVTAEGRKCVKCLVWKTWSEYRQSKRHQSTCRDCRYSRYQNQKYGVAVKSKADHQEQGGGQCRHCKKSFTEIPVVTDHDHGDLTVRGFICRHCNACSGMFGDDPRLIERAIEYVLRAKAAQREASCSTPENTDVEAIPRRQTLPEVRRDQSAA